MKELLICALNRRGKPGTAGDITDEAIALAQAANWPRRSWAGLTVKTVAALMKGMEKRREILRVGIRLDGKVERPVWGTNGAYYDISAPMPDMPDPEGEDHPLHGTTNRQKFVLFDVMDACLAIGARHRSELNDLVHRQTTELAEYAARAKRELLAAGMDEVR